MKNTVTIWEWHSMAKWYRPSTWRRGYWVVTVLTYKELIQRIVEAKTISELEFYKKYLKEFYQ